MRPFRTLLIVLAHAALTVGEKRNKAAPPPPIKECEVSTGLVYSVLGALAVILVGTLAGLIITRGKRYFRKLCDEAFDAVDIDKTGSVDVKELYAAVLLVYLKLNKIVSVQPPELAFLREAFEKLDDNNSKTLSRDEFYQCIEVLSEQALGRVGSTLALAAATPWLAPFANDALAAGWAAAVAALPAATAAVATAPAAVATATWLNMGCEQRVVKDALMPYANRHIADLVMALAMVFSALPMLFAWIDRRAQRSAQDDALVDEQE